MKYAFILLKTEKIQRDSSENPHMVILNNCERCVTHNRQMQIHDNESDT